MYDQVDQIGRFFAHCMGVYFWQFSENYKSSTHYLATSLHGLSMCVLLNFDKIMGWAQGDQSGRIFAYWVIVLLL
jgi:hypothetical protein